MIIFLLILLSLELGLAVYFIYYSLIRPEIENKRKIWQKVEENFAKLEKGYEKS